MFSTSKAYHLEANKATIAAIPTEKQATAINAYKTGLEILPSIWSITTTAPFLALPREKKATKEIKTSTVPRAPTRTRYENDF